MRVLRGSLSQAVLMAAASSSLAIAPATVASTVVASNVLDCTRDLAKHGLPADLVVEHCNKQAIEAESTEPESLPVKQPQPSASTAVLGFSCVELEGLPTTIVSTDRGNLQLIAWKSKYFSSSGYSPQARCQIVSNRFHNHAQQGNLHYISHGILNRQKVLCVAERTASFEGVDDYRCQQPLSESLLLTLEAKDDPERVLSELFDVASQTGPQIVTRGGSPKPRFGINLEELLGDREPVTP